MDQNRPEVFLSYAWGTQRSTEIVEIIAIYLTQNGVYVHYDQWDVAAGNDLNAFMEKMVQDKAITKVLMFCDEMYCKKADDRKGGVGTETQIISAEVYNNTEQSKFIPIALEIDDQGKFRLPIYLKSRKAVDLTDDALWEDAIENILRDIFGTPAKKRPPLGPKPDFENPVFQNNIVFSGKLKRMDRANDQHERIKLLKSIIDDSINNMKEVISQGTIENYLNCYSKTLPFRNFVIDAISKAQESNEIFWNCLGGIVEKLYNELLNARIDNEIAKEMGGLLVREIFISIIAILRSEEDYNGVYYLLHKTYFLKSPYREAASTISEFYKYPAILEEHIKPSVEGKNNLFTFAGDLFVSDRLYPPIITQQSISEADLLIFQLSQIIREDTKEYVHWFPYLYVYCDPNQILWKRLVSKSEALKIMPILGVKDLESLKKRIISTQKYQPVRYNCCFNDANPIYCYIKAEEIGTKF